MACNCGSSSSSTTTTTITPPNPAAGKAPDGTVIGSDISHGGTVAAYGSAGGGGVAGANGGYQAAGTQHATGLGATINPPNSAVGTGAAALAKKYESSGNYGAYNGNPPNDPGGASYGAYQIATKPGTMNNFLNQLQTTDPTAYQALQAAGGNTAALAGDPTFVQAWKDQAANNPNFANDQDAFIQATHYDPAVAKVQAATGLDINAQSLGVQQAMYSWAVQSPNGSPTILANALAGKDVSTMSQADIINTMYDARSASLANTSINSAVQVRLASERQDALAASGTPASSATITNQQSGV